MYSLFKRGVAMKIELNNSFIQNKSIEFQSIFQPLSGLNRESLEEAMTFVNASSFKEALKKSYNISSPRIVSFCQEKLFPKTNIFSIDYFIAIDTVNKIFTRSNKLNHNDFIQVLERRDLLAMLYPYYNERIRISHVINEIYPSNQVKTILENSSLYCNIADLTSMFLQNDEYFKNVFNRMSSKDKNSLDKCHDICAKHITAITQKNYSLNQESHYSAVVNLGIIDKEYRFLIPQTHHDLVLWGSKLGHCIGASMYAQGAARGEKLLLGIEDRTQIRYALEIVDKRIVQIEGASKSRPPELIMNKIRTKLKEQNLID